VVGHGSVAIRGEACSIAAQLFRRIAKIYRDSGFPPGDAALEEVILMPAPAI
jgi:hypothetical protein